MARASREGSSRPAPRRVSMPTKAPAPPKPGMGDVQRQGQSNGPIGKGMPNPNARANYFNNLAQEQANTQRMLGIKPAVPYADWLNQQRTAAFQAAQGGQYPTVGRTGFNPQMSRSGLSGYNTNMLMGNQLRAPRAYAPQGPYAPPPPAGQTQQYGQYAPVRSYAQGYASQLGRPQQQFQIIPGAPQWLQDTVGQQVMGWGAGGNSMQTSRQQAYDYQMANYYAKGPPYVEPPAEPWGGYGDWGGYGGGGGGGYDKKPEWFERMINWEY